MLKQIKVIERKKLQTTTNEKILGFLELPQGWHYGEGSSPSEETVNESVQINNEANLLGLKTEAFPGINGEIQLYQSVNLTGLG